jgi:hypothetical protein
VLELCDLYRSCSRTIVRIIKYRRLRWAEHVARIGKQEMRTEVLWETSQNMTNGKAEKDMGRCRELAQDRV